MKQFPEKVAIIGVGLIGGSIAMGLKKHFGPKITIFGLCSTPKRGELAVKQDIIDKAFTHPKNLPDDIDIIILAAPISINIKLLKTLKPLKDSKTLIIDVGSTKSTICKLAVKLGLTSFIGTHPMAGREVSGFERSISLLFKNKPWIITPTLLSTKSSILKVESLVKTLNAKPIIMTATEHDRSVTWASHIPLLIASLIIGAVKKQKDWKGIEKIATSGFHDTTRLASHESTLKNDITLTNNKNLVQALSVMKNEIDLVTKLIIERNKIKLNNYFTDTKNSRDTWIAQYRSQI